MVERILRCVLYLSISIAMFSIAWLSYNTTLDIRSLTIRLDRDLIVIGAAAGELEKSAREWRAASQHQQEYWTDLRTQVKSTLAHTDQTVVSLNHLIASTDSNLNEKILPQLSASIAHQDHDLAELTDRAGAVVTDLDRSTQGMEVVLREAAMVLSNPNIPKSLDEAARSAENINVATSHVAESTKMLEDKVKSLTKPASWAKTVGLTILGIASQLGNVFAGFFR